MYAQAGHGGKEVVAVYNSVHLMELAQTGKLSIAFPARDRELGLNKQPGTNPQKWALDGVGTRAEPKSPPTEKQDLGDAHGHVLFEKSFLTPAP